jgi:hypothetical protein
VAGLLLFLAVAALVLGASRAPGLPMLVLAVVAAVLAAVGLFLWFWALAYQRLTYALTDSALRIEWLGRTLVVPYQAIQGIYSGQRLSGIAKPNALRWPGINVGTARVRGLRRLRFFATSSDQSLLTLITVEHGGVIISANDPQAFRGALIERVEQVGELATGEPAVWQSKEATSTPWSVFDDAWLPTCVGLGVLGLLSVLAIVVLRYDGLPDEVALHFDAVAPKSDLLRLPLLGLVTLIVNWVLGTLVHARERVLARLLWLAGAIVQLVLLVGLLRLLA